MSKRGNYLFGILGEAKDTLGNVFVVADRPRNLLLCAESPFISASSLDKVFC